MLKIIFKIDTKIKLIIPCFVYYSKKNVIIFMLVFSLENVYHCRGESEF